MIFGKSCFLNPSLLEDISGILTSLYCYYFCKHGMLEFRVTLLGDFYIKSCSHCLLFV